MDSKQYLRNVGIGKCDEWGGTSLADLEKDLIKVREQYGASDAAKVIRTAPGSIYFAEVQWIGPASP